MATLIDSREVAEFDINEVFDRLDTNGDGKLNFQELSDGLSCLQVPGGKKTIQDLMTKIDTHRDGTVSRQEFSAFVHMRYQEIEHDGVRETHTAYLLSARFDLGSDLLGTLPLSCLSYSFCVVGHFQGSSYGV